MINLKGIENVTNTFKNDMISYLKDYYKDKDVKPKVDFVRSEFTYQDFYDWIGVRETAKLVMDNDDTFEVKLFHHDFGKFRYIGKS